MPSTYGYYLVHTNLNDINSAIHPTVLTDIPNDPSRAAGELALYEDRPGEAGARRVLVVRHGRQRRPDGR
jgi:hypothetical protein